MLVYGHTICQWQNSGEIFHFNLQLGEYSEGGNPASYGMLDNDVPSVIALNDQSIIAQVAINPVITHNSKCAVRAPEKEGFLIMEQRRLAKY